MNESHPSSRFVSRSINRRSALKAGFAATALGMTKFTLPTWAFTPEMDDEVLVSFLDMPQPSANRLNWEQLNSWLTPTNQAFNVQHYGIPEVDPKNFSLEIAGLVEKPLSFSLEEIKRLPKKHEYMTLECAGNGSGKGFINGVYNSKWTGTPLKPLLKKVGVDSRAIEVVFYGEDTKLEMLRPGTRRELEVEVPFGRSLSLDDALGKNCLLAYERNGEPLEQRHGAPLRLIVPGWYGIANVKWLTRIELRDQRYVGRYMGRDYVTVRGERWGDKVVNVEHSVGRIRLKSVIGRVTQRSERRGKFPLKAYGAAWGDGTPIKKVQVKVDDGMWQDAVLDRDPSEKFCWKFFSIDLGLQAPGKHSLVSRAIDANGRIQPSSDDDEIALKKTYWEANQQWVREVEIGA
jgi:DMSO/TMAO reductase YedYZ molybdopterin-dependent catalytic subunit